MANINLYQTEEEKTQSVRRASSNGSILFSLGIFLLVLAIFGGSKLLVANFKGKKEAIEKNISEAEASFSGDDVGRVLDFNARMDEAVTNISGKIETNELFSSIESAMTNGVVATDIKYGKIDDMASAQVKLKAESFLAVARQILSFKESKSFSNVIVTEMEKDEEGIHFLISAKFLNKK